MKYTDRHAGGSAMLRKLFIWGCVAVCCLFLTYAIWVIVAMKRTATISVDYVALLNEKAAAVPVELRAWPLYREAAIALRENPEPASVFYEDDIETPTWPTQEGWVHYTNWLQEHASTIILIRDASKMQGVGYMLTGTVAEEDKELWPEEYEEQQNQPPPDGFFASVLLQQLGPMRSNARVLSMDAKAAAANLNATRCVEDLLACLAIAEHAREQPLLICDLVSLSIYNITFLTLEEILEHQPSLFTQDELDMLLLKLQNIDEHLTIRFEGERMFVLDLLQRMFTDDGNGDGKIIPLKAMELGMQLELAPLESTNSSLLPTIFAPIADLYLPSRKQILEEYDRRLSYLENLQASTLHGSSAPSSFVGEPWVQATSVFDPYYFIDLLTPTYDKAIEHASKSIQRRDALLQKINELRKKE